MLEDVVAGSFRMKKKIGNIQKKSMGKRLWGKEILIGLVSKNIVLRS